MTANVTHGSSRRARLVKSLQLVLVALVAASFLQTRAAEARGGSSFSVTTTGAVTGTAVSGVVTVTNDGSTSVNVSATRAQLEVRFQSGTTPPPLPAGSSSGWYVVASQNLPLTGAVAANSSRSVAFTIDSCGAGASSFPGAKDMRAAAVVTAGQSYSANSLSFALPAKCPVCGNGIVEAGEQCDQGYNGGQCCASNCRFRADGTACSDANGCTTSDQCQAGTCVGGAAVACSASDQCHTAGTCNPASGVCSNPAKADGTACNDQNACTQTDSCQSGFCSGGNPVTCTAGDQCQTAACNPSTGTCSGAPKPDGTECIDGNACTAGDHCAGGACVSGEPRDCNDHMTCTADDCDTATGCGHTAASCEGCDAGECAACGDACDAASAACSGNCWNAFFSCLNGCTSTYCAPFCQFTLSQCVARCPSTDACRAECDAGNSCGAGCTAVQ